MNKKEGLTLIELLATVAILVSVVAVMLALGDRAVGQTGLLAAQEKAVFLSKAGIEEAEYFEEALRNEIGADENWNGMGIWRIEYDSGIMEEKQEDKEDCKEKELKLHGPGQGSHTGLYGYKSGDSTPFSRCVIVRAENENDDLKVTVETFFSYRREEHSATAHRIFYD